jgi:Ni,Fe-hydrogenase III small subunit
VRLLSKIIQTGTVTEALPDRSAAIEILRPVDPAVCASLGRALGIREVDAGSCNGCELEIAGLVGPIYDIERFGIHIVASPRHADILLVTGPVTRNMEVPLRKTFEAMPEPRIVVAVGDCAKDCGIFRGSYAVAGPVDSIIPVNVIVRGCPPEPSDIILGVLTAVGRVPAPAASDAR